MNENTKNDRKRFFVTLFIFQILVLVFTLAFCCNKYEVSDDFIMELMLSGAYSGQLNWHIMFSSPFWGMLICLFYNISNCISWYFIIQLVIIFISYISISWVFSGRKNWLSGVLPVVLLTMCTAGDLYILPQFTKTAAVAFFSGSILFLYEVFFEKRKTMILCGGFLAIIGTFIRFTVLYSVGLFIIVVIVLIIFLQKNKIEILRGCIFCLLLIILIYGLYYLGDHIYKMDANYEYFKVYNSTRARIVDYQYIDYQECEEELKELGISENDYLMLIGWNLGDPEKYDLETLKQISAIVEKQRERTVPELEVLYNYFKDRGDLFYPVFLCCLFLIFLCTLLNWKRIWVPVLCVILCAFYMMFFYTYGRLNYRIEFGCFFAAAGVIAFSIDNDRFNNNLVNLIVCSLVSCVAIMFMGIKWVPIHYNAQDNSGREVIMDYLINSSIYDEHKYHAYIDYGNVYPNFINKVENDPESVYLMEFATTIQTLYFHYSPFISMASVFPNNLFWIGGVTTEYPTSNVWMEQHGYQGLLKALVEEDVYYVGNYWVDSVKTYLQENGFPQADVHFVEEIDGFSIWKFRAS